MTLLMRPKHKGEKVTKKRKYFSENDFPKLGQRVAICDAKEGNPETVGFVFGILHRYGGIGSLVLVDTVAESPDDMLQTGTDTKKVAPSFLAEV